LKGYAEEYFHLEAKFPGFLMQTYEKTSDSDAKEIIMENYNEETEEGNTHASMWMNFAKALGADENAVKSATPLKNTQDTLSHFDAMTKQGLLEGMAALLAYEANLQKTSATKIDGLKKFYGLTDEKSTEFFKVHGVLDIKHSQDWKDVFAKVVKTKADEEKVKVALTKSMESLWHFLDGVHEKFNGNCGC